MSKPANQYYQERASRLGIREVPPILGGRPCTLWQTQDAIGALATTDQEMRDVLEIRYAKVLEDVASFVLACAGKQQVEPQLRHLEGQRQTNDHITGIFGPSRALPRPWEGRVHAVCVEAIPGCAINIGAARIAFEHSPWRVAPEFEDESVFLQLSTVHRRRQRTSLRQAHVIAHPHEFYEPTAVQYRAALYDSFEIGPGDMDVNRYLRQVKALPFVAEFWQDGKLY